MIEKLAEMVREQVEEVVVGEKPYYSICYLCELEPANGFFPRCLATEAICNEARKKRDLKLARLSVLLVAKGLTYEADGITPKIWTEDTMQVALMNLIAEAKEDTNDAV